MDNWSAEYQGRPIEKEKYIVSVGGMWVSSSDGQIEDNGKIFGIKSITLTSDIEKARVFDCFDGAKSVANKIKTYGVVVKK